MNGTQRSKHGYDFEMFRSNGISLRTNQEGDYAVLIDGKVDKEFKASEHGNRIDNAMKEAQEYFRSKLK